jgi:hypothetical protein
MIDGTLFGHDAKYTRELAAAQPDPYFFLNIARDLRDFDTASKSFDDSTNPSFIGPREILSRLQEMGFA